MPATLAGGRRNRHGGEQREGVGVGGLVEQLDRSPLLDELAAVHDDGAVGDLTDDGEVVGDEQDGHPGLGAQPAQETHDLALRRHVERRHRLVTDDQGRPAGQRTGDRDPLPLPAGELGRVAVQVDGAESDLLEQLGRPRSRLAARALDAVEVHRLGEQGGDGHRRVE